jgi:hypothetical protein
MRITIGENSPWRMRRSTSGTCVQLICLTAFALTVGQLSAKPVTPAGETHALNKKAIANNSEVPPRGHPPVFIVASFVPPLPRPVGRSTQRDENRKKCLQAKPRFLTKHQRLKGLRGDDEFWV